ncbi:IS1096 element passenger TnpR family protein [Sunxiuqinia sp. sy24]|uniref:IS1096 element passenger TnpR family protein n=1 Tax=Sunxiuqinia sp. sy24 TaxID=3461495 RepID=UPI00404645B8
MVYQFKITSIENTDFLRIVEIDSGSSFADLHWCIQKCCNYSSDQLASFFIAGENYGKQLEITFLDFGRNGTQKEIMGRTQLHNIISIIGQRLLYVFDFFNDRSFYIELTEISMKKNLQENQVTYQLGDAPAQVLEEELQDQGLEILNQENKYQDYGDLDDYTEIFGEMEDLIEGD